MKKTILIGIIILALCGGGYYWYTTKDLFTCDDYISFMTLSVDEFEKEFDSIPLEETGTNTVEVGIFKGKEIKYRKYAAGNILVNYLAFTICPEDEIFLFETNILEVQQETKNLFKDCGFKFIETIDDKYDIYHKKSVRLLISKRSEKTVLGSETIHSFWLEKE